MGFISTKVAIYNPKTGELWTKHFEVVPRSGELIEIKIPNEESLRYKVTVVEHCMDEQTTTIKLWVKEL